MTDVPQTDAEKCGVNLCIGFRTGLCITGLRFLTAADPEFAKDGVDRGGARTYNGGLPHSSS